MDELNSNIKGGFSKCTSLDKTYNRFIKNYLFNCDDNERKRWEIYSDIINEITLANELHYVEEIKYRITGGENINQIILNIINKDQHIKQILKKFTNTINYYADIDLIKKYI